MKTTLLIRCVCAFQLMTTYCVGSSAQTAIIPTPQEIQLGKGIFRITDGTKLYADLKGEDRELLTGYLKALPVQLKDSKKPVSKNVISLLLSETDNKHAESYSLVVTPEKINITASKTAGLFYGIQTLLQMAHSETDGGLTVQEATINDTPRFDYRGLMLDVSRHFFSKEFVKKQIDMLAHFKINRLHLHLTDGAGWRIEIKKYPLLTEFAAWRPNASWKKWWQEEGRKYCRYDQPGAAGGFYTQDDIREIVAYARDRFITIIPEIEMPSHSEEVLATYPQLSCSGVPYQNSDFCVGNEETFAFLEEVLTEVMDLFPSEYIHIGGDEAGKGAWRTCPKCQKRMKDEHLANVDELQSYLIHRIEKFINSKGRKLLGWDEILEGGLAPNASVMSWRGEQGGIAAVRSGHKAIMTPGGYCYFDSYQDAPYSQPEAIGGYLPLERVYSYNPVPDSLTADEAKYIYGVQANLWAEYIPTPEHSEYMIYPRILALAEVGWTFPEHKSWPDFHARALKAVDYLESKGYHPFELKNEIGNRPESLKPTQHMAIGKKVTYNLPWGKAYPSTGVTALVDGIRGGWSYGDNLWQGFINDGLDVTIDLGNATDVHYIGAGFMQNIGPYVYFPNEVIISISEDGKTFKELTKIDFPVEKKDGVFFKDFAWEGDTKARYIRYKASADESIDGAWLFTDEIIVK